MCESMGDSGKYSHDKGVPPLLAEQPLLGRTGVPRPSENSHPLKTNPGP